MRLHTSFATIATAPLLVLLGAAARPAGHAPSNEGAARAGEVRRVRRHFDSVLVALGRRDVAALSPGRRARRAALLATLRAYRDRGEFPHNYDFPGRLVPYFVDRETGTLCAVAHLLAATGRRDVVDRVARTDNNVLVPQLAGDTAFTRWLDASGLTLDEAAFIQVPYESATPTARTAVVGLGSVLATGTSLVTGTWNATGNADGHRRTVATLGAITGLAAVGLGAASLTDASMPRAFGGTVIATGALSTWLASRSITRHRHVVAERRAATRQVSVTPLVPILPSERGAGVAVNVRF